MWIKTTERKPEEDGYYLVYMNYGEVNALRYTVEGGWNTYRDYDGVLHASHAIDDSLITSWLDAPLPPMEVKIKHEV